MKKFRLFPIWVLCMAWLLPLTAQAADTLIPVGQVVGLELQNDTLTVAAFDTEAPARDAGLQIGDRLLSVDGHSVRSAEDVRRVTLLRKQA